MNTKRMVFVLLAAFPLLAGAQDAAKDPAAPAPAAKAAAATAVLVTGSVQATSEAGARSLGNGAPVYEGDTITVAANSYANLKFADGGRILLRPNTEFTVEAYRHNPADLVADAKTKKKPESERAFFRLVRGGFRAISGLISGGRDTYRVTTPTATIGIRGTDYEVQLCTDDCPTENIPTASGEPSLVAASDLSGVQLAQAGGGGGGVVVATNDGLVVLQTGRGEFLVKVGEVAFAIAGGQVYMLPVVPDVLLQNYTPSPEDCE